MIVGAAALTVIIVVVGIAANSYASGKGAFKGKFKAHFSSEDWGAKKEKFSEKYDVTQEIFANNDYEAWKALMEEKVEQMQVKVDEMAEKINQETFSKLAAIYKLMQDGNYKEAIQLKQELGFGGHMGKIGNKTGWHKNLEK